MWDAASPTSGKANLPMLWRGVFALEIAVTAATALYLAIVPGGYLAGTFGVMESSSAMAILTWQYAAIVLAILGYFYARWLMKPDIDMPLFRNLQEGLLLRDGLSVVLGLYAMFTVTSDWKLAAAQVAFAFVWGVIRMLFLRSDMKSDAKVHLP